MIEWTSHPAKRRPQDALLAIAIISFASWAVMVSLQSGWLALIAAALLAFAIAPFLAPTRYRIDDAGIAERRLLVTRSRRWSELRRLEVGARAALLSPYAQPRWLDRYRGITVYFDGAERDAIVRELAARISSP